MNDVSRSSQTSQEVNNEKQLGHSAEKDAGLRALPMVKWSDPNPDCLLVKRGESHAAHALSGPGGNKPGSHCGGIDAPGVLPPGGDL